MHDLTMISILLTMTMVTMVAAGGPLAAACNKVPGVNQNDLDSYCLTESGVRLGTTSQKTIPPRSCKDLKDAGQLFSGVYTVYR